ncbi:MAG: M15 family metallopeptidase [Chloroflexi bacterium]|nr:M15 family metallopeptidase [Chloroflexota bacterium]
MRARLWPLLALGLLATAALSSCGGDEASSATVVIIEPSATSTTAATAGGASPTAKPNGSTATPQPQPTQSPNGEDTSPLVPCGDILVPLDKQHRLPADCAPGDLQAIPAQYSANGQQHLRAAAANALIEMFQAAAKEGYQLYANSGYRSYDTQVVTFNNEVATYGREQAERQSARPGHSEHQLGTTMDITSPSVGNSLDQAFGDTAEGKWLAANSWKFGFVMSYPPGKEANTGYTYEPWHFRYIGKDAAASFTTSGKTLHDFLLR